MCTAHPNPAWPPQVRTLRRLANRDSGTHSYRTKTALAKEAPRFPSAFVDRVLKRTTRPGDRSCGVRFPWGRAIVEKTTQLVGKGGAPDFRVWIAQHWSDAPVDAAEREDEAVAMVLRHERKRGDGPYTARARFRLHQPHRRHRG